MGVNFILIPHNQVYTFSVDRPRSNGSINFQIPTPKSFIPLKEDVVKTDVPFLVGIYILDNYNLYTNTVKKSFLQRCDELGTTICTQTSPLLPQNSTIFTRRELLKMHRGFSHLSNQKLFNLLKIIRPAEANAQMNKALEEIVKGVMHAKVWPWHL